MGRYDKIRVYNGSSWVQPSQIYVYNAGWKSLGTNTGDNQSATNGGVRHLYANKYSYSSFTRATLEKKTNTVTTATYSTGSGRVGSTNYCWNPSQTYSAGDCYVSGTFKKTAAYDQNIFYTRDNNGADANCFYITWLADGRIRVRTRFNYSQYYDNYSSGYYSTNTWYKIKVLGYRYGSAWRVSLYINDVRVDDWGAGAAFVGVNKEHLIGDTYIQMKDTYEMQLQDGSSGYLVWVYLNMNNNNSGYGFGYKADTTTTTSWV